MITTNSKPKYLVQYFLNNKSPMEVSRRLLSEEYIQDDDRGIVIIPLSKLNEYRTFKIWEIFYGDQCAVGLDYIPYSGEVGFK